MCLRFVVLLQPSLLLIKQCLLTLDVIVVHSEWRWLVGGG